MSSVCSIGSAEFCEIAFPDSTIPHPPQPTPIVVLSEKELTELQSKSTKPSISTNPFARKRVKRSENLKTNDYFNQLLHYGVYHDDYNVPEDFIVVRDNGTQCHLGKWLKKQKLNIDNMHPVKQDEFISLFTTGKLWNDACAALHVVTPPVTHGEEDLDYEQEAVQTQQACDSYLDTVLPRNDAYENLVLLADVCSSVDRLNSVVNSLCSVRDANETEQLLDQQVLPYDTSLPAVHESTSTRFLPKVHCTSRKTVQPSDLVTCGIVTLILPVLR